MILAHGVEEHVEHKKKTTRYRFFRDYAHNGRDAVYGIDQSLTHLVDIFKSASRNYGTERRVILLHGPVGSAKSTIVRLLKKGLEEYSRTPEGAMYTFAWTGIANDVEKEVFALVNDELPCPMREDPLHLIPTEQRGKVIDELIRNSSDPKYHIQVEGDLCPACRQMYRELTRRYKGDWFKVMDHVKVRRLCISEKDRIGIGTFQPKDEKNSGLDGTHRRHQLPKDRDLRLRFRCSRIQFRWRIQRRESRHHRIHRSSETRSRVSYMTLLGASQEHKIKPKKFPQTDIDEVIIGHTNEPEYRKLQEQLNSWRRLPRPHCQDRCAVHHETRRRDQGLREGLQLEQDPRQAHRTAYDCDGFDVGRADAAGSSEESQPHTASETEAV
jgi:serine protein kinase